MMNGLFCWCVVGFAVLVSGEDPDVGKGMVEIVMEKGYPIDEHFVTTSDGYILGMFRIPYGRAGRTSAPRKPVLLQHGLLDSSYTFVNNFPEESLGFILADAGYDVWFGNNRGNAFSKRHVSLNPDSKEFWDFTYDQMAQYDMPAQVRYVLNVTGYENLTYAGHSEGTTQAFAALSLDSTNSVMAKDAAGLSSQLNLVVALAPVGSVKHQQSRLLSLIYGLVETFSIDKILEFFGVKQFMPSASLLQSLAPHICTGIPTGCDDAIFLLCGVSNHFNSSRVAVYVSETPAGTSVKNMGQWGQNVEAKQFQMFDYGCGLFSCPNMDVYRQKTPPLYDLTKIAVPMALFSGGADDLGDPTDVAEIVAALPPSSLVTNFKLPTYAHLDFVWGVDAHTLLYPSVMDVINKYNTL